MKRISWILLVIFLSGLYNTATGFPIQKKQMKIPGFEGKDADTAWINFYINQGFLHLTKKDSLDIVNLLMKLFAFFISCGFARSLA